MQIGHPFSQPITEFVNKWLIHFSCWNTWIVTSVPPPPQAFVVLFALELPRWPLNTYFLKHVKSLFFVLLLPFHNLTPCIGDALKPRSGSYCLMLFSKNNNTIHWIAMECNTHLFIVPLQNIYNKHNENGPSSDKKIK